MRILWVDPGGTSGLARYDSDVEQGFGSFEVSAAETGPWVEASLDAGLDLVGCESFFINANTLKKSRTGVMQTIETIGVVRFLAMRAGVPFEMQAPTEKNWATNERLETLGWRSPSSGGHADDAARHLVVACLKRGLLDISRFVEEDDVR